RCRAAAIEEARAQTKVHAQLRQPTAAPDPVSDEGEDYGGEQSGNREACGETQTVRARSPGQQRGQRHRKKLKEQRQLRLLRGRAEATQKDGSFSEPTPRLARQLKNMARACGRSRKGRTDHGK